MGSSEEYFQEVTYLCKLLENHDLDQETKNLALIRLEEVIWNRVMDKPKQVTDKSKQAIINQKSNSIPEVTFFS